MKNLFTLLGLVAFVLAAFVIQSFSVPQQPDPWNSKQLMEPSDLAKIIEGKTNQKVYVYSIGPAALIKNSIDIGEGSNANNIAKLKEQVSKLPKDAQIVIYCGCCPFKNCPNVRPAFSLLNEMKFTNHKLLNLSNNLREDWIAKGYPTVSQ
ncbi:MAG: rhodanese-like domain-containing protein [Bacteroidia bacterium]|nr:rhodanese-like domain-containing protein [Bacteroidia bacterium]MCZ2247316.1 rhodanese-like domain-containing protein [Bacteroidia bacterium]